MKAKKAVPRYVFYDGSSFSADKKKILIDKNENIFDTPKGKLPITKMYVDPVTKKLVVEFDDNPV